MTGVDREALAAQLEAGIATMGLAIDAMTQDRLIAYLLLLYKWNKAYNLTAVREPRQMVVRHLLDSLAVLPYLPEGPCIDVGAGAGLPGIPLALSRPDQPFVLLDSNGKKTRFLTQVKAELGIANMTVVQSRVRSYTPEQRFAAVISRAFASLGDIARECGHLIREGGTILAMKGNLDESELAGLPADYVVVETLSLAVPGLEDEQRHVLRIERQGI